MNTPENDMDADESSGVTTLRPVPVKPARLLDLSESDSTHYFSASELLERGKALAAQTSQPAPVTNPEAAPAPEPGTEPTPQRAGLLAQFRRASFARKASALLLPLACALLLAKPMLKEAEPLAANKPSASAAAPISSAAPTPAPAPVIPAATALALPRGVTLAHAAADSVATGDFSRAGALYRELSQREPNNQAYAAAARILSERAQAQTP